MKIIPIPKILEISEESKASAALFNSINFVHSFDFEGEKYSIDIEKDGIKVVYGSLEGKFRAETTLKQINAQSENGFVPCLHIVDYPSIKNRGVMLDISRGKLPELDTLKKYVDLFADLKYNQLQLYMESFVYEYKNFKKYCTEGYYLTRKEIEELTKYCKDRFIELVPNQNGFGHMHKWTAQEELKHLGIVNEDGKVSGTLNPLDEGSLELMDKIYDGFMDAFDSDKINIGLDEPFSLGKGQTKEACEKYGVGKVYTDYLKKLCHLISSKYNKTPMFWDDIVFKHPEQLENVPASAIVMDWGYESENHFDRNCRRLQENGLRYYVCPGTSAWASITGRFNNAVCNIIDAAECGTYYGAEGFLLTEWGDYGNVQFPAMTYFAFVLGGAASWNSLNHDCETAYLERRELIDDCKWYLDRVVFKSENGSLADIICRMGNYYLLENRLLFNSTELIRYVGNRKDITEAERKGFERVYKYMKELKDELDTVSAADEHKEEAILNCEMVILFSKILSGDIEDKDGIAQKAQEIENEYIKLWNKKNHKFGYDIFLRIMKRFIDAKVN